MANVVEITIKGVDKTGDVFKKTEESANNLNTALSKYAKLAGAAVVAGVGALIVSSTKLAARVETLGVVTTKLGENIGWSEEQIRALEQSLVNTGITLQSSRQSIAMMIQANVDLAKSTDLARLAQDAAVIAGVNSSEAFQTLVYVIQTGNVRMARTLGLQVDFQGALQETAKQLGKTTDELTEEETILARTNAVMEAGSRITGTYEAAMGTAGKQLLSLDRYVEEFKVSLGNLFIPVLSVAVDALTDFFKTMKEGLDTANLLLNWTKEFTEVLEEHEKEVITTATSYQEYVDEMERAAKVAGIVARTQEEVDRLVARGGMGAVLAANSFIILSERGWEFAQASEEVKEATAASGEKLRTYQEIIDSLRGPTKDLSGATGELSDEMKELAKAAIEELNYLIGVDFEDTLQDHENTMNDLTIQYDTTKKEIDDLIKKYGGIDKIPSWKLDEWVNLQNELGKTREAIDKEEEAWKRNTDQILFNMAARALEAMPIDIQGEALGALAESMGLIDEPTREAWENVGTLTQLLGEGKIDVGEYGTLVDTLGVHLTDLPEEVTPEVILTVTGLDDLMLAVQVLRRLGVDVPIPAPLPSPERRQHGGPVLANMPYLVGEGGPELFIPSQSGRVESTDNSRSIHIENLIIQGEGQGIETQMAFEDSLTRVLREQI